MKRIKISILTLLATVAIANTSQAQFGKLKNLKNKKISLKKKSKTSSSSSTTSSSSTSSTTSSKKNKDGRPEYDSKNPVYRKYSSTRDKLRFTKTELSESTWNRNPEGANENAEKYLKTAKEGIDFLKANGEEGKAYLATFEKEYKEYSKKRESLWSTLTVGKKYSNHLRNFESWITAGRNYYSFKKELFDKSYPANFKGYETFKNEFKANASEKYNDDYTQKRLGKIDKFFSEEVYEIVPSLQKEADKITKEVHKKNSSGKEDYLLNAPGMQKDYNELLEKIKYQKETFLANHEAINKVQAQVEKDKVLVDDYISSGEYQKYRDAWEQARIDAVRLGKKKMSNAKYESLARQEANKKDKVLRVVITSSVWSVKKNGIDIPEYKYLGVDIAVKKDNGKCYSAYGQIRRTYEGGGKYGGAYFNYWGPQEEMNCKNINK